MNQQVRINGTTMRVRMAILDIGWTELAARSGLSRMTLYRMEAGGDVTLDAVGKLAAGLGCNPIDVLRVGDGFPLPASNAQAIAATDLVAAQ